MTHAGALRLVALVSAACGAVWFLHAVRGILAPFVVAAVCAYVLSGWVARLEARGVRRSVAVTALFLLFFLGSAAALAAGVPRLVRELSAVGARLPEYAERVKSASAALSADAEARFPAVRELRLQEKLTEAAQRTSERLAAGLPGHLARIAAVLSLGALVPFIAFFFMLEGRAAIQWLFDKLPARHTETTLSLLSEIDDSLGSYVHGQVVESLCVGALSAIGLHLVGVDYALLIGGLAGVANMIPYLGPFVGSVPAMLVGFAEFQSFAIVAKVALVFAVVQFLDNNVIQPAIMSRGVNIHPLAVLFSVMAGAEIGGLLGMLLAVPVACVVKIVAHALARRLAGTAWRLPAATGAAAADGPS